jgi:cation:H+ antiporter
MNLTESAARRRDRAANQEATSSMIVLWIAALVLGVAVAAGASKRAVSAALETTEALGVSAGFVGITVMAIGTDLPEIANSIMASISDHGDLNVGDSTGSAFTQVTLILALLILAAGLATDLRREESQIAVPIGLITVVALVVLAIQISDGHLSRFNGIVMVSLWVVAIVLLERGLRTGSEPPRIPDGQVGGTILQTILWLGVVGGAAALIVRSFIEITDTIGVPEFIASSIVLALGTSLPELVVDWTAIRRGAAALAIGDLFGATLIDSTVSVGAGPIVSSTAVSTEAMTGTLIFALGIAVATIVVSFVARRRAVAYLLILTYLGGMTALIALAS